MSVETGRAWGSGRHAKPSGWREVPRTWAAAHTSAHSVVLPRGSPTLPRTGKQQLLTFSSSNGKEALKLILMPMGSSLLVLGTFLLHPLPVPSRGLPSPEQRSVMKQGMAVTLDRSLSPEMPSFLIFKIELVTYI